MTSRAHTGQGYLTVGPGFGCMSPAIRRSRSWVRSGRRRSGFVVEMRISSAAANWPEAENPLRRTADCQDNSWSRFAGDCVSPDSSTTSRPRSLESRIEVVEMYQLCKETSSNLVSKWWRYICTSYAKKPRRISYRSGGDIYVPVMQRNLFESRVYQLVGLININHGWVQSQIL